MTWNIRRIISGHDADGKAGIVSDEFVDPVSIGALPGASFQMIWGTNDIPVVGSREEDPAFNPYFPGPGGVRIVLFRCPPDSASAAPQGDPEALMQEAGRLLPGALQAIAPDDEGMHKTDTVDFNLVLEGEIWFQAEGSPDVLVPQGSGVLLHGTRHAWHNRTDKPVYMLSVFIGARRAI
jgi:hypothetical protein